jgi:hypothetical protein
VGSWKRRVSDGQRSVLLSELLLRHPELAAEAEEITSALLALDDRELTGEITARLRTLRVSGPASVDAGRGRVLEVLQPYTVFRKILRKPDFTWAGHSEALLRRRKPWYYEREPRPGISVIGTRLSELAGRR